MLKRRRKNLQLASKTNVLARSSLGDKRLASLQETKRSAKKRKSTQVVKASRNTYENYPKATRLVKRDWRDDLLVTYVERFTYQWSHEERWSGRTKTDLPALYDELEAKIRDLESLGRTQEKYGNILSPLVESCLPEEILVAWERS
ncbi:hypothetical protein AVEN_142671-1 [Araneus ventricosus]|uniref:Uncharacterized protein n=1 Tax=Araneus ventricosus TaxID=182803 RepID=A0A4Y2N3Y5_ARAVE|nr:hypothetical protein AVEN_142671-1 [Araneus ventricosus]